MKRKRHIPSESWGFAMPPDLSASRKEPRAWPGHRKARLMIWTSTQHLQPRITVSGRIIVLPTGGGSCHATPCLGARSAWHSTP